MTTKTKEKRWKIRFLVRIEWLNWACKIWTPIIIVIMPACKVIFQFFTFPFAHFARGRASFEHERCADFKCELPIVDTHSHTPKLWYISEKLLKHSQKRRIHKYAMICSSSVSNGRSIPQHTCISIIITFWNLTHQSCGKNDASSSPTWRVFSLKILEIYSEGNAERNKEEINWKNQTK